jgi:hypothetical protein
MIDAQRPQAACFLIDEHVPIDRDDPRGLAGWKKIESHSRPLPDRR